MRSSVPGMLHYLRINNLALIDEAELEFGPGFITVSGETGAGKSVLLGALSLIAGGRASKSVIRQGQDGCEVDATLYFAESARMDALLESLELPPTNDGELLLQRRLYRDKPGRALVNGQVAALNALQRIGGQWVDFHGPGEPQKLFSERTQLELLDLFASNGEALSVYQEFYYKWKQHLEAMQQLRSAEQLGEDEAEFLRGQLAAIEAVPLDAEAIEALERDYNRLDKARELNEAAAKLSHGLSGERGVSGIASGLVKDARALAAIDPEADALRQRLEGLIIEAEDLGGDYATLADAASFNPTEAEALQQRMHAWLDVKRRFGPALESVLSKRQKLSERLGGQGDIEGRLIVMEKEASQQHAELERQAAALTNSRTKAAKTLAKKARELLLKLGFKKPALEVELTPAKALSDTGDSTCRLLFSPNPGQSLMPLNQIASSGETARVMLALKTVLAEVDQTPVLVFDEVDANVGGEAGREVGRELARLGGAHQVLCVTHLPQVAAFGAQHWAVEKRQDDASTEVAFRPLHNTPDARLSELARMLGDAKSSSAREHAKELLNG